MTRRYRNIAAAIAAAFLFAGQPVWADAVLCIGEDGHVAYEAASGGDSCQSEASPARQRALQFVPQPADDHCGVCQDIILAQQSPVRGTRRDAPSIDGAALAALTPGHTSLARVHQVPVGRALMSPAPGRASTWLATVVIQS